jgi:hypothetical protein
MPKGFLDPDPAFDKHPYICILVGQERTEELYE